MISHLLKMMKKNQEQRKKARHDQVVEFDNVYITEDLILEILLRLPPIPVLRFKSVCKNWYSLMSNPEFLRSQSSIQFEKHTCLMIHDDGLAYSSFPVYKHFGFLFLYQDKLRPPLLRKFRHHPLSLLPEIETQDWFPENDKQYWFLEDSCNGLLLFSLLDLSEADMTYYIYNPITKQSFKLPSRDPIPNITEEEEFEAMVYVVFDPSVSLSYKVIRWLKYESGSPGSVHCQIYSSETGSWRLLSTNMDFGFYSRATLLNGVLYWSYWTTPLDVSYCFDVVKESFSFLPLPPKPIGFDYRLCLYFGECGGRLRLIEKYSDVVEFSYSVTLPLSFDVMELEHDPLQQQRQEGYSLWIVKYHVNIEMDLIHFVVTKRPPIVEFIHCYKTKNKRGEEEEVLLFCINQTSIASYDFTSNTIRKELAVRCSETRSTLGFREFYPFTPTLFPIS